LRAKDQIVGASDGPYALAAVDARDPWYARAISEADQELRAEIDLAGYPEHDPDQRGDGLVQRHEIYEHSRPGLGPEFRLQYQGPLSIPAPDVKHLPAWSNSPTAIFIRAEQGRKAGRTVEARPT
jgi:hypothetical protein